MKNLNERLSLLLKGIVKEMQEYEKKKVSSEMSLLMIGA